MACRSNVRYSVSGASDGVSACQMVCQHVRWYVGISDGNFNVVSADDIRGNHKLILDHNGRIRWLSITGDTMCGQ